MITLLPPDATHRRNYRDVQVLCVAVCFVLVTTGCVTSPSSTVGTDPWSSPMGQGPVGSAHASDPATAAKELALAKRMVQAGEFSLVIPRLQQIISKYPGDSASVEARYYLGKSYYSVGAFNDALRYLNQYIDLAPEGEFAPSGREIVAQLTNTAQERTPTELESQATTLQKKIDDNPENMAIRLELANLYWEQGQYDNAGGVYEELLQRWPLLADDLVVKRRVERNENGQITILTPLEVERRHRESNPLLIYNVSAFKSGRFEGWPSTAHQRYYNVTGQATNQSEHLLQDVKIITTIYGVGHMVYDTKTVTLGVLRPGEVRAFSVQFSQFDNIHNVTRHECLGTFRP